MGSRARKIRSIAPLASVPRGDKNSDAPDRPFGGPVHSGPRPVSAGQRALPRYWIPPTRRTGSRGRPVGGLLIRHLSSSGTFRGSYDASLWPPVGIARVLRRNSVSAPRSATPLAQVQRSCTLYPPNCPVSPPPRHPSLRAYSRFADSPALDPRPRVSNANPPRNSRLLFGLRFWLACANTRPAFMGL